MINPNRLFGFLANGVVPEMTALDESLAEHDKKYHPEGYSEGDECSKRLSLKTSDDADNIDCGASSLESMVRILRKWLHSVNVCDVDEIELKKESSTEMMFQAAAMARTGRLAIKDPILLGKLIRNSEVTKLPRSDAFPPDVTEALNRWKSTRKVGDKKRLAKAIISTIEPTKLVSYIGVNRVEITVPGIMELLSHVSATSASVDNVVSLCLGLGEIVPRMKSYYVETKNGITYLNVAGKSLSGEEDVSVLSLKEARDRDYRLHASNSVNSVDKKNASGTIEGPRKEEKLNYSTSISSGIIAKFLVDGQWETEDDFNEWLRSSRGDEDCAGWYDRKTGEVKLVKGAATAKTVAHELGWHATFHWAEKNHPELHKKLMQYAKEAPDGIVRSVKEKYSGKPLSPEALLDEIGAERFTREDISELLDEARRRVAEGWFDKVEDAQDETRRAFVAGEGKALSKDELDEIAQLSPKQAVEALVKAMMAGRSLGSVNLNKNKETDMTDTQDGWGGMPNGWGRRGNYGNPPSLQQHDKQFHGGHYTGGTCSYRGKQTAEDPNDMLPGFSSYMSAAPVSARHGMFDDPMARMSPQELDQMAVKSVCSRLGVKYSAKGIVQSGRWQSPSDSKLEYTVVDPKTGLFASGRGNKDYMVLARAEEAMSFSSKDDADAVAKATGANAKVLDKNGYNAFKARKMTNNVVFPKTLEASDLKNFRVTMNGSTEPYVGTIGDSMFIAKKGSHTTADHVRNEDIANRLHLAAGLNAPRSKVYEVEGEDNRSDADKYIDMINGVTGPYKETVMLAEYIPNAVSLESAWNEAKKNKDTKAMKGIRDQVLDAYPFESFVAGIDLFQNDNALVDADGKLWMVDNGAAFDYRARGGRKGWFNNRTDPKDKQNGLMSLVNHPSQTLLRDILKGVTEQDVLNAAKKYDFEDLVTKLPSEYQTEGLKEYAKNLNEMTGRNKNRQHKERTETEQKGSTSGILHGTKFTYEDPDEGDEKTLEVVEPPYPDLKALAEAANGVCVKFPDGQVIVMSRNDVLKGISGKSDKRSRYDDNSNASHIIVLTYGDYEDADSYVIDDMMRTLSKMGATGIKTHASEDDGEGLVACRISESKLNKLLDMLEEDGAWEFDDRGVSKEKK